jgi:hypothetical protein
MTDPRHLLDAYACEEIVGFNDAEGPREDEAPKAFAALRAVLDECDREDEESIGIVSTGKIRAAITNALEAK